MRGSAENYEDQALQALDAAYTSSVNVGYNLAAAQVYASLSQAAAAQGLAVVTERLEDVLRDFQRVGLPVENVTGGGR